MPKFKEGDRVVLITDHCEDEWKLPKGSIGTVASTLNRGYIDVSFDDYKGGHNGDKGSPNDCSHLYVLPTHIEKAIGYKFKSGDKVVCTVENNWVPVGTVGIVAEDNTSVPYVDWATGDRYCLRDSSMELYSPAIKKGDRVRLITDNYKGEWELPKGTEGTVFAIRSNRSIDVDFDNWEGGHDGETGDHHISSHLYVRPEELEKTEKQKGNIVLFRQGNKVIAKLTYGKSIIHQAEATCNPEDTFDFLLGSQIALQRLIKMFRGEDTVIAIPGDLSFDEVFVY